jgi:carboxylate-amine ligase
MSDSRPAWAAWRGGTPSTPFTIGIEEEVMLLDPADWSLSNAADTVLRELPPELAAHVAGETHASVLELATGIHTSVGGAASELRALRDDLAGELDRLGLRAASAGTHPAAVWQDTAISSRPRYQLVYGSMRELARREPTLALHVHVGVATPAEAIRLANRLRGHVPLLLALSANSPFWHGRRSGLASARTPLFQAFPRTGVPRRFRNYRDYVQSVDLLIRAGAIPEPTFLWWDVRPQPRFGTVEVRVMDAQTTVPDSAALAALVQSVARLELEQGFAGAALLDSPEAIDENRFLAARDGMDARFIEPDRGSLVAAAEQLEALLRACEPHARMLGCAGELASVRFLAAENGAARQLSLAREGGLGDVVAGLAAAFSPASEPEYAIDHGPRAAGRVPPRAPVKHE